MFALTASCMPISLHVVRNVYASGQMPLIQDRVGILTDSDIRLRRLGPNASDLRLNFDLATYLLQTRSPSLSSAVMSVSSGIRSAPEDSAQRRRQRNKAIDGTVVVQALSLQSIHSDGFPYAHLRAIAEAVNRVAHSKFLGKACHAHDRTTLHESAGPAKLSEHFPIEPRTSVKTHPEQPCQAACNAWLVAAASSPSCSPSASPSHDLRTCHGL